MTALVEEKLDAIRALCEEFDVLRLELFGSAATGAFDPERSDLDFLVEYPQGYDFGPWATRYVELQQRLEALFGCAVALVMADAPRNPYVIESINESRRLVYPAA
jgi:predicted nucleotidyltransferase